MMDYSFDVDKIVAYLEQFKNDLPLLYKWNAKIDKLVDLDIISPSQLKELNSLSPYEKELILEKQISKKLWQDDRSKMLYYTEMLLFSIADREIFQDITNRISLEIS